MVGPPIQGIAVSGIILVITFAAIASAKWLS